MPVEKGNKVKIEYEGTLSDGSVFDSTEKQGGNPLEFVVGSGQIIKGFDDAVVGMEKNEEKSVSLMPKDAYGDVNPEMVKEIPRDKLPKDKELKEGMMLALALPDGNQIPAKIAEVGDSLVKIDLNHPLAGKNLNFKIKVFGLWMILNDCHILKDRIFYLLFS